MSKLGTLFNSGERLGQKADLDSDQKSNPWIMSTATDILEALRRTVQAKEDVRLLNDAGNDAGSFKNATHLGIGPLTVARSAATRFRRPASTATDPTKEPTGFYVISAIYAAWLFKDEPAAEYMKRCHDAGVTAGFVTVTDRKGLVDWLEGKRAEHEKIVPLPSES